MSRRLDEKVSEELKNYLSMFGLEDVTPLVMEMARLGVPDGLALKVVRSIAAHRNTEPELTNHDHPNDADEQSRRRYLSFTDPIQGRRRELRFRIPAPRPFSEPDNGREA